MYPEQNDPTNQPQKPIYSVVDTVYAWICLLMAFLFRQSLPVAEHPLGGFLLILTLFLSGFVILRIKKKKLSPVCIFSAVSSMVIGSALVLSGTEFLIKLSMTYCLASYCYFLYAALGNRIEEGFSDYVYIDFVKILFILPFRSIGAIFPALSNKSEKKSFQFFLRFLGGVGIAIIPTLLVLFNLSYDASFVKLLENIFTVESEPIRRTIKSLILTLPLAMYGFGLYASSDRQLLHSKMNAESCQRGLQKAKFLPQLTAAVSVTPILFLYVVFFISQWKYYVSGFTGNLPADFSYAEYARQGFFELCAVSVINLLLIVGIAFFIKRGKNGGSVILKIVATVFCLCTLILISTAIAKLVMYIQYYGLTPRRIYAMWLMVLIGIVFLLIALGQFIRKFKAVAASFTVAIVLFAALGVCNVNALCANYNTNRYLSGSLETVDVVALQELGDSAIPALVQLANAVDREEQPQLAYQIDRILNCRAAEFEKEEFSPFSFCVPSAMAKAALKGYNQNTP